MKLSDSTSFVFDLLGSSASYFQNASLVAKKFDEDGIKEQRLSDLSEQGYISRDASAVAAYRIPKQLHGTPGSRFTPPASIRLASRSSPSP